MSELPFKRTVCACDKCKACCTRQPGFLIPSDVKRIEAFLGVPVEPLLWASRGALVKDTQTNRAFAVPTITPRMKRGRCVFLDAKGKCSIHAVAPYGCAFFDTHMLGSLAQPRSMWGLKQVSESEEYTALRRRLPIADRYKPNKY